MTDRTVVPGSQRFGLRMDAVLKAVEAGTPKPDGTELDATYRQEIIQYLKRLPTILDMPLAHIPADPAVLRKKMAGWKPSRLKLSKRAVQKLKSAINVALDIAGARQLQRGSVRDLYGPWRELFDTAEVFETANGVKQSFPLKTLVPFFVWCQAKTIVPAEVHEDHIAAYAAERDADDLDERPVEKRMQHVRTAWNRFAGTLPAWPGHRFETPAPDRLRLPEMAFSDAFRAELDAYERCLGVRQADRYDPKVVGYLEAARAIARVQAEECRYVDRKPDQKNTPRTYDPTRPLRLKTAQRHCSVLRLAASTLIRHGIRAVEEIKSIGDVATPEVAVAVLRDFDGRHGADHVTSSRQTLVSHLMSAAVRWRADLDGEERSIFQAMKRLVSVRRTEMSQADRATIEPLLMSSKDMASLISLPLWIYEEAERERKKTGKVSVELALKLESALPILIMTSLPVRLATLTQTAIADIRWPQDPCLPGNIYWPPEATKTNKALSAVLAPWKMQILDGFVAHYRPELAAEDNPWLFAGRRLGYEDGPRSEQRIAINLKEIIVDRLGVEIRTHLWRKLMAGLLFDATNDERVVRYLLGHAPNSQATDVYVDQMRSRWASATLEGITEALIANREGLIGRQEAV